MPADVNVQFFSNLNNIPLGPNWGDLIRLLDKALVTGIDFSQVTAASVNENGDLLLTFYTDHKALLFQIVELSGFAPASLNQKYRIKGVPGTRDLILRPHQNITQISVTTIGTAKLAPLGYEIIFRDTGDVKRVYRSKNPTNMHPFIRVDESLSSLDGASSYNSAYAKYAVVGLLESMDHLDDFEKTDVLQLPFYPANPKATWNISGTGISVSRGMSRWYYASRNIGDSGADTQTPAAGNRAFTLVGDKDAFYLLNTYTNNDPRSKKINGCGLFDSAMADGLSPNWFLMTHIPTYIGADNNVQPYSEPGGCTLTYQKEQACFYATGYNTTNKLVAHVKAYGILPDYRTGDSILNLNPFMQANMTIPFHDGNNNLRGTLKHILYVASTSFYPYTLTTPRPAGESMYVIDSIYNPNGYYTGVSFYLGELN